MGTKTLSKPMSHFMCPKHSWASKQDRNWHIPICEGSFLSTTMDICKSDVIFCTCPNVMCLEKCWTTTKFLYQGMNVQKTNHHMRAFCWIGLSFNFPCSHIWHVEISKNYTNTFNDLLMSSPFLLSASGIGKIK